MMLWFEPFMWTLCRALAFVFQLIGVTGLTAFVMVAACAAVERLAE